MDPDRWRQVEELYHAVLEKKPDDRAAFLENTCTADPALRQEVESLLAFADDADGHLQSAVQEVVSQVSGVSTAPKKLGRYELLDQIGKGGMGVVYRAFDPAIGRTVAIKTILLDETDSETAELRARLLRESQAGGRLSHPHIVAVHDVSEEGKTAYIVMEFIEGRTLAHAIRDDPSLRSSGEAVRIIQECASALDYAHARGVVHRDIKPANIMLQADGAVKIADFGIAKIAHASPLTQSSLGIGSPHYMAPEQWRGEAVTGRADQYALAAVAYTLLTGRRPFEGDAVAALAAMALYEEPPAAVTYNAALNLAVDAVLRKALSKDAAARYETCSEFAAALRGALENPPTPNFVAAMKPVAKPKWIAALIAVVLVAVVAAGGWLYYQRTIGFRSASTTAPPRLEVAKSEHPVQVQPPPKVERLNPRPVSKGKAPEKVLKDTRRPTETPLGGDPYVQADSLLKQGDYTGALPYFTQAIAKKPDYRSYFGRAGAYQRLGKPQEAIDDYTKALGFNPDSGMAYHDRAVCEAQLKQNDNALADYTTALKLAPDNPRTWNGRGAIYLRRNEYTKALQDLDQAILRDAKFVQAYENRAKAKQALGKATDAQADLDKARALKEQQPSQ